MTQPQIPVNEDVPRVLDTYAVSYAFILLFLVPGVLLIVRLPFRTYTFAYVSLVTVPFVLGLLLTFITDSRESLRTIALRCAVLIPLVIVSAVGVMFTGMMLLLPLNGFMAPQFRQFTTPVAGAMLAAVALPLVFAIARRARVPLNVRTAVQALTMVMALLLVAVVVYLSVFEVGRLGELAKSMRKDVVIYIVGALVWYLPSFGISAGVWRRLGLV